MKEWKKWRINRIENNDPLFPRALLKIKPEILGLYYRGEWDQRLFEKSIGVVGSRRMTAYGKSVIEKLMPDLVGNGLIIVSGFMYGVDTEAHSQCIENGGKTIAVFGGGLDCLLPEENDKLYTQILESGGMTVSEYDNDFKPTLWSFPQRNRIVCGLSTEGVLVVEAGENSGSLITAKLAEKQGKKVYAVPGPITTKVSMGTNWLIGSGKAKMVTGISDILAGKIQNRQVGLFDGMDSKQQKIIDVLADEPLIIDELAKRLKISVSEVTTILSLLSLSRRVKEVGGKFELVV